MKLGSRLSMSCLALALSLGALAFGCDRGADAPRPQAEVEEVTRAAPMTPNEVIAWTSADDVVLNAMQRAHAAVARQSTTARAAKPSSAVPAEVREGARVVTLVFGANNHGEREDCGCKSNPLGGLTRRETLVELAGDTSGKAGDDAARTWWGEGAATEHVVHVDAGDLFFKSTTISTTPEPARKTAMGQAEAVAKAMALSKLDAINVGEIDVALGLDELLRIGKAAKLPLISANLLTPKGEAPLPGHVVVERGGLKIGIVGLTKEKSRLPNYYAEHGARVAPPEASYLAEVAKLPAEVDLVVMLSNLGVQETLTLVEGLRKKGARVDAAIVSNSNRLTNNPEWAANVPVVEPMSRGKYLGRMDLYIRGEGAPSWTNATPDPIEAMRNYRRAWSNYIATRQQINGVARELVGLEVHLGALPSTENPSSKGSSTKVAEAEPAQARAQREAKLNFAKKELETAQKRLSVTSEGVTKTLGALQSAMAPTAAGGDDWLSLRIVPVKLAIPEDSAVRKSLDAAAK